MMTMRERGRHIKRSLPRFSGWMVAALITCAFIFWQSPQQLPVATYKFGLITLSAVVSYWVDRSLFGESAQPRLDNVNARDLYAAVRLLARALIYLGTVIGLCLGI